MVNSIVNHVNLYWKPLQYIDVYWGWVGFTHGFSFLPGFCPAGLPHVPPAGPTQTTGCETTALRPGRRVARPQRSSAVHHGSPLRSAPKPCGPCDLWWILGIRTSLANQIMARIGKTQGHPGFGWFWRLFVADLQRHIRYFMEPWSEPKTAELKLEFQTYFRQQLMN